MNAPVIPPLRPPERAPQVDPLREVGRHAIWRAGLVLAVRQALVAFWPFLLCLKLALIAALLGVFPLLGPLGHTLLSLGCAGALVGSFILSWRSYHGISEAEARRAVERASGLTHRPLTTLADKPAIGGRLWEQHRQRAGSAITQISLQVPHISLRSLGSPLLRYGSWAALALALLLAWDEAPRRLQEAAEPPVARLLPSARLDVWVTPPAYTGQPPIALQAGTPEVVVPEGSTLSVRVSGGWFPPVLELPSGSQRLAAEASGQAYHYTGSIGQSGWLKIRQDGHYLGKWAVRFLVDMPPGIEFTRPPEASEQKALRLDYTASDDIGLTRIEAEIEPAIAAANSPHLQPLVLALPLASPPPQHASAFRFFDLTAHPLAGSRVYITLRAFDGKNQITETTPVTFTLPERSFAHPIAKALIRLRRELLVRGFAVRHPGVELVNGMAEEVEEGSKPDFVGVLALRVVANRLKFSQDSADIASLERLMWDTALHFEDGGAGQAFNRLRQAQQALEDALSHGASDQDIQQLMRQLEEAMNDYLDELQSQGQPQGEMQSGENGQTIDRQDLQNLLEQMRQLAQSGARDQAQEMLRQMQQMMENLQSGAGGQADPQLGRDMERLGEIRRQQQGLMQSQPENGQTPSGQQGAQQQENLREQLGETMQGLLERGYDVGELGRGERAMNNAREQLEQNNQQEAAGQQGQALEHLQQGMRALQEQAQQRAREGKGGTDPFGRRPGDTGNADTSKVEIPDRGAAERARQVLDELRRRAGDYSRPSDERDYLERLLKWF